VSDAPAQPVVGVGAVVFHAGAVLLVRRGRPPYAGEWAIPGGRVRLGESLQAAAEREIAEETGVVIRAGEVPVFTFEHIERDAAGAVRFHYVVLDLPAEYLGGTPRAGDDAAEARWVAPGELGQLPVNTTTRRCLAELGFGNGHDA